MGKASNCFFVMWIRILCFLNHLNGKVLFSLKLHSITSSINVNKLLITKINCSACALNICTTNKNLAVVEPGVDRQFTSFLHAVVSVG